jgi:hypothetical protein
LVFYLVFLFCIFILAKFGIKLFVETFRLKCKLAL